MKNTRYETKTAGNHKLLAKWILENFSLNTQHTNMLAGVLSDVYNKGYDQAILDMGKLK